MLVYEEKFRNLISRLIKKQTEEGWFSPFSKKEAKTIFSLLPQGSLEKHESRFFMHLIGIIFCKIYWHSKKCMEVLKKINPVLESVQDCKKWVDYDYEKIKKVFLDTPSLTDAEKIKRLRSGSFSSLYATTVDPELHTLLLHINAPFCEKDRKTKRAIVERMLEKIFFYECLHDPANLSWVLVEWIKHKKFFQKTIPVVKKKFRKYPCFEEFLDIVVKNIVTEYSKKIAYVKPLPPPFFDATPEIYGVARSTAYTFIDFSILINEGITDQRVKTKKEFLFNWIQTNFEEFKNPYLEALLLECYCHAETKENAEEKLQDLQKVAIEAEKGKKEFSKSKLGAKLEDWALTFAAKFAKEYLQ